MKQPKPWIIDAINYWSERIDECDIGVDWGDGTAETHCWRCGYKKTVQKCHIVPKSLGGSDDVSNLIPLCSVCHDEAPNVSDPNGMWDWIKESHAGCNNTFWIEKAFKEANFNPNQLNLIMNNHKEFVDIAKNSFKDTGLHRGQNAAGIRTTIATWIWVLKQACKNIEERSS